MNNLDHVKNFYPENYKLDLSETMKAALSKGPTPGVSGVGGGGVGASGAGGGLGVSSGNGMGASSAAGSGSHVDMQQGNPNLSGIGYVTEKLYMLLQLYLQNKGWNPSAELLQCFTDLKDNALLPSAAYLQVLANRLTLDAQGRLILRENGKIVLPFEHFANAVMLKHMSGPHGLHLSVDATVRAVIESYTIGRENFGMEKEFIIEVVQSCPSPACRYYKNHMGMSPLPFMDQQFPGVATDFLQHLPHLPPPPPHPLASGVAGGSGGNSASGSGSSGSSSAGSANSAICGGEVDLTKPTQSHSQQKMPPQLQHLTKQQQNSIQSQLSQLSAAAAAAAAAAQQSQREREQQQAVAVAAAAAAHHQQQLQQQAQQQAAAAAAAAAAKQQQQQQQQQQAAAAAAAAAAAQQQQQLTAALIQQQNRALAQQSLEKFSNLSSLEKQRILQQLDPKHFDPMAVAAAAANLQMQGLMQSQAAAVAAAAAAAVGNSSASSTASSSSSTAGGNIAAAAASISNHLAHQHASASPSAAHLPPPSQSPTVSSAHSSSSTSSTHSTDQLNQKNVVEALRSNLESLESNKDLLALHNGAWGPPDSRDALVLGQEKIVRVFTELMRNMARMKTYIRPSMCKPYGKQSESLQKTLMDTIQVVQTLRTCLPAPHIPVTSWKSESEKPVAVGGVVPGVPGGVVAGNGAGNLVSNRVENLSN